MYVCLPSSTLLPILFFSAHSRTQSLNFCWAGFVANFFGSQIFFAIAAGSLKTRYTRASLSLCKWSLLVEEELVCASFRVFEELLQQHCWVGFITARLNSVCYTTFLVTELWFCWVGGLGHTYTALVCCCLEDFRLGWWEGRQKLTLRSFGWNMILGLWTSESFSMKGHNSFLSFKHFCRIVVSRVDLMEENRNAGDRA
jgi:hypothetical protein